ncbi:carbohydrate esterase family 5 protein [Sphaerobolus stellatus SS14]|uniref:Carbohydrate esterase family 5 protein n=1 Tax=Sphaerobolus stellatus (strain SS14) TaxID=990650 RepID=A0A0C9TIC1_SPHS4|nr:carbohydrate esterase family 5 protein [Sphaerobolus stellatus SS14]
MFTKAFFAIVFCASIVAAVPAPAAAPVSPCADVHIIAARASTEAPGAGIIGALVTQVQKQSSQTVSTDAVDYPATLTNYASSSAQGTAATMTLLTNQANTCPEQKIVLVGYSQGAQIIGDAVAGGGGVAGLGPATAPVPASIANRVVAIVQMGDPRHVVGQSFDRGTSTLNGLFPRAANQQYSSTLQPRIESFCDFDDPFCASGVDVEVHLTYLDRYQNTAAQFILTQIGG